MDILIRLLVFILLLSTIKAGVVANRDDVVYEVVRVGLVVDLGSIEGKILQSSLPLALSDFYRINNGFRTRVSVSVRDSQGDPLLAFAAATDLLKTSKVEAIVGAQSLHEAKLLSAVSEKANVPVISPLPVSLSLKRYHHFIQLTHDSTSEAKGITKLVHDFDWESVVVVYEDVDDWREGLQIILDHFQDDGIHIHRSASFVTESSLGEEYMVNQLQKLKSSRTAVFVVHISEILVSRLFRCAEKLGMMEQGYAWILTARTMNHFHYTNRFAVRSMQGVIGFRSFIPLSEEVESFTSRLRKLMADDEKAGMETKHSSPVIGVWAHDIACILATAVEKIRLRESVHESLDLLETIRQNRFKGLSHGDIQISGSKFLSRTFEIVNMVGTGERRIGLWNCDHFYGRRNVTAYSANELETIIWPGGSGRIPSHRLLAENTESKKVRRVLITSTNRFPHLVAVRTDPLTGRITFSGFCVDVFVTCVAPLNYEWEFIPYDGVNYDNLAYELYTQRDKYDAAVGDITITSNRSLYVEFTLPYTDMGIGAMERLKKREMWTFFEPLEKSLWLASGAFFILTGIVVWLVERTVNPEFQGSWGQQLGMMLWFGFSTLVFAHREKLQKMSSRFLVIVWVFVVLILTASYSANLTSTKTVSRFQLDGFAINNAGFLAFSNTRLNTSKEYAQALLNETTSFVVDEIPYLRLFLGQYPGVFNMIDSESISNGFGFMFQRGSGLAPNVSTEIAKLRSSGKLKEIEKRWFVKLDSLTKNPNTDSSDNDDASKSDRLTIQELGGLFIIAGIAHGLVLALHLFQNRREILRVLWESRLFAKLQRFSNFLYK